MLREQSERTPFRIFEPEHGRAGTTAEAAPAGLLRRAPAQPEVPAPDADAGAPKTDRPRSRRQLRLALLATIATAVLAGAGWYGHHWLTVGRYIVSTDDAYVSAYNTTLAAKVSGYVSDVAVADNAVVHEGDVIARIDDGDYRLAVNSARDRIATQQASIERLGQEITAQQANVEQAKAQVAAAMAARTRAQLEFDRQQALVSKDFASQQKLETARADRDQADANVQSAKAAVAAAEANIGVLQGKQDEARRTLDEMKTELAKAERDLSSTVVRAPIDGVIGNRGVQVGDYVTPGARLASIVPLDRIFIDANFKETQLVGLKPGQTVAISVDALPDRTVTGTVESLAPASGSVFSLLPPDNATGNFTKIVQRLPVRISVPADVLAQHVLRPGMSVIVDVNTKQPVATAEAPAPDRLAALPGNPER